MLDLFLQSHTGILFGQLVLAMVLGSLLGLERSIVAGKTAGVRTYALVTIGSCLFVISSLAASALIIAGGIITGIGFLGAGLIIKEGDQQPHGLTTAAGLWVAAGIGMTVGFGLLSVAVFATFLTLFVFNVLWFFEDKLKRLSSIKGTDNN